SSAVAAAEDLLATFEASTPGMRAEELRRAEAALRKADTAVAEAQAWRKRADANVVERTPTDRQTHHALEGDWVVADRTQVAERLERLAGMTAEHRSRLTEAQTTLAALTEQVTTAETDIERVGIAADSLDADPLPGMR